MMLPRVRCLCVLVVALVLVAVGPAWADDASEEEAEPPALHELTSVIAAEVAGISTPGPLAGEDLEARLRSRIAGVDLLVGTVRVAAADRIRWMFPGLALSTHQLVVGGSGLLWERAGREGPSARWLTERAAAEWQRLEELIDELRLLAGDRAPVRLCPVPGVSDFEDDWHDDRPWGRVHKGNDLHGEIGTPLLAIESGTVVQASWHWAGGRQIYFRADSTGDVYYYAHLDRWAEWIWTGTRVRAGDEVGTLGRSGNADSPHLHFGWMPGSRGVELDNLQDPYPLLVEICA